MQLFLAFQFLLHVDKLPASGGQYRTSFSHDIFLGYQLSLTLFQTLVPLIYFFKQEFFSLLFGTLLKTTDQFGRKTSTLLYGKLQSRDRKSTRLNSTHVAISYAVFYLKKKHNK